MPSREAGQYNTRIAFYKNTTTVDAYGEKIASWAKEQDAWAKWEPLVGRTLYQPDVDLRRSHVVVRVRHNDYTSTIDPDTVEVRKGSERYAIEGHPVNVDGLREEIVLRCVKFD